MIHSKELRRPRNDSLNLKLPPTPKGAQTQGSNDMLDLATDNTSLARTRPSMPGARTDSLIAIERDMLRYEREATAVRKFLADVTRRGGELKNEARWCDLKDDWDLLNDRATEIEKRACAVKATTPDGLMVKQRVADWLRVRAPGLDRTEFAQSVIDSMRNDALAMALN